MPSLSEKMSDHTGALFAISALMLIGACGDRTDIERDTPTFDAFLASLDRFEDAYVIESDIIVHSEAILRSYYEWRFTLDIASTRSELTVNVLNTGQDDIYLLGEENNLTYCITDDLGRDRTRIAETLDSAAANWEAIIDVDFIYVSGEDSQCNNANTNVSFNVR